MAGSDLLLRLLISASDMTGGAVASAREGIQSISTTAQSVYNAVKNYLTFRVAIDGAEEFVKLADTYTQLQARIRQATTTQAEYNAAQSKLFSIAQQTGSSLESIVNLYSRTQKAVTELGLSQESALKLTEVLAQSFKVSGASAAETGDGIQQLAQALGSGVLRGDEFNTVMEAAPRLAQALADGLNVPIGKLRAMAEAGELTSEKVVGAVLGQGDKIAAEYAKIPPTVERSLGALQNSLMQYAGQANEAHHITQMLAQGIDTASAHLGDFANITLAVGAVAAGKFAQGLLASARAGVEQAAAAKLQKTVGEAAVAAQRAGLEVAAQEAQARATVTAALVRQAQADLDVAKAKDAGAMSSKNVKAATEALGQAQESHERATRQATAAVDAHSAAQETAAKKMKLSELVFKGLNAALMLPAAWEIGQTVGGWATQFESARLAGSMLAQKWVELGVAWRVLKGEITAAQGKTELAKIAEEFKAVEKGLTDASQKTAEKSAALSQAQKDLAEALASTAPKATHTAAELDGLKTAAAQAEEKANRLAEAMRKGQATEEQVKQAAAELSKVRKEYSDATEEATKRAEAFAKLSAAHTGITEANTGAEMAAIKSKLALAEASGQEAEAARLTGALKQAEVDGALRLAAAKRQEADAATKVVEAKTREAMVTPGLTDAELTGIAAARQAADAKRKEAAEAQNLADTLGKLPPVLGGFATAQAISTGELAKLHDEAQTAIARFHDLEATYATGKASAAELAQAHGTASGALAAYTKGLQDHGRQLDAVVEKQQRQVGLVEKQGAAYLARLDAMKRTALAQGDEARATELGLQAAQAEYQQALLVAKAKQDVADASKAVADSKEKELKADGLLDEADQKLIAAAQDAAKALQLEADAAHAAAIGKAADAQASEQAAAASKPLAKANDQTAQSAKDAADATDGATQAVIRLNGQLLGNGPYAVKAWADAAQEIHRNMQRAADVAQELQKATNATDIERLTAEAAGLASFLENSSIAGQDTAGAARQIRDAVQQANDKATQLRDSLANSASQILANLNAELANAEAKLRGASQAELAALQENQAYQEKLAALQKQASDAQKAGAADALKALQAAMAALDSLHDANLRQIAADNAEKSRPANASPAPSGLPPPNPGPIYERERVIPLTISTGSGTIHATAPASGAATIDAFVRQLKNQARTS